MSSKRFLPVHHFFRALCVLISATHIYLLFPEPLFRDLKQKETASARSQENHREISHQSPPAVEPYKSHEQELSPGQTKHHDLSLVAGQYVRLNITCRGIGVDIAIQAPDGQQHRKSSCHNRGNSLVSMVARVSGNYAITISAQPKTGTTTGRYVVKMVNDRRSQPQDEHHILAERAFEEAEELRTKQATGTALEAIVKYQEARHHWQAVNDSQGVSLALMNIGKTYQGMGRFDSSLTAYNQALVVSRARNDLTAEAAIRNCIGYLQFCVGENQEALTQASRALQISKLLSDKDNEALARHTIGNAYYGFGNLPKALGHLQQALQLWQQLKDTHGQAAVLVNYGYAHIETSEIQTASDSFDQALSLSRAVHDQYTEATALRALGNLKTKLGDYEQAFNLYLQALDILKELDDPYLKATVLGGLAYSYECAGELRRALMYYKQALEIFQVINDRWGIAESEMPIGEIHYALGEHEQALLHYGQALELFRSLKMTRWQAMTLRNIGLVHDALGDKPWALSYYQQSLALVRSGQDQRHEAYTLSYVGRVYEHNGSLSQAQTHYERALNLSRVAMDPAGESLMLYNLAHLERRRGNLTAARNQIEAAIRLAENLRTKLASQDLRAAYFASAHQYHDLYIDILMRLHVLHPQDGYETKAFEASEKARARSLLESLREGRAGIRNGVDAELLKQERELLQQINAKADRHMRLANGKQTEEAEALAREISQLTAQHDQLKVKIKQTSPHYAALTQPQPLSLREIQQRVLDEDSLLLEYALGEERSYVWVITRTEIASFVLPGRAEIESLVRRCYELLIARPRTQQENIAAYQERIVREEAEFQAKIATLSQMLLQQVAPKLTRKRLLVVADGALQYLPFQALLLPKPNEAEAAPLIAKYEIVNEPSASALAILLQETAGRKPAPNAVAVLADPVFEASDERVQTAGATTAKRSDPPTGLQQTLRDVGVLQDNGKIPRLYASREEANAILALTPWRKGFSAMDFEASRATFTNTDFSRFRIIHLATHGFLSNDHPEMSGIVLSLVDRQGKAQEGFLRQLDIYNLTLPVELVVLSACNTGLGKDVKGEGLVGLTRGFMYAGAASVVASLWKVDDNATAELMQHFYEEILKQGYSPAAALRQAQLAMLKQKRWRSPYYWAGFVIQGQYANSAVPQSTHLTPWLIACLAVGTAVFLFVLGLRWRRKQTQINAS